MYFISHSVKPVLHEAMCAVDIQEWFSDYGKDGYYKAHCWHILFNLLIIVV